MLNTLTRDTVAKILPVHSCLAWMHGKLITLFLLDSESNFVVGFREAEILSSSCFAHTLQLVVEEGVLAQRGVDFTFCL